MSKIQKLSGILKYVFMGLAVLLPVLTIITWVFIETPFARDIIERGLINGHVDIPGNYAVSLLNVALTPFATFLGCMGDIIHQLDDIISFYLLSLLFALYQRGRIFEHENVKLYRYIGYTMFIYALFLLPLGETLKVLAVTLSQPVGERIFSLSFGTPNIGVIITGLVIILISHIMDEGRKMKSEQQLTV